MPKLYAFCGATWSLHFIVLGLTLSGAFWGFIAGAFINFIGMAIVLRACWLCEPFMFVINPLDLLDKHI